MTNIKITQKKRNLMVLSITESPPGLNIQIAFTQNAGMSFPNNFSEVPDCSYLNLIKNNYYFRLNAFFHD